MTLIGIEGHHGKSFNPQTLQETDRKAPMRNDFSFPVDSVSMQHCCIDSELDLVDLVKLRTAQGKELAILYGKFSPFGRSPLKIHQTRLSRNQGSAPISIDIALSKNQLKLDEENPQYNRAFDYSPKQRRFWGAFSLVVQLLGGNFSRY